MGRIERMNAHRGTVVIVGSINLDLVLRVDHLPAPGETVAGAALERHGGGKGANQAVAAARAGADVVFVGAVGDDEFGEQALNQLRDAGINVSRILRVAAVATGLAAVIVDRLGENQIAVASGANSMLDRDAVAERLQDVPEDAVLLLNLELPDPALAAAAARARASGIRSVVVNPAPARSILPELLELNPILTPNAGEARALVGCGATGVEDATLMLRSRSGAPVVVTLGSQGALMLNGENQLVRFPAPVVEAVDATGAGDAFNGALAAALAQGHELEAAVRRAVIAGAACVGEHGARGGMLSRAELDRRMAADQD